MDESKANLNSTITKGNNADTTNDILVNDLEHELTDQDSKKKQKTKTTLLDAKSRNNRDYGSSTAGATDV